MEAAIRAARPDAEVVLVPGGGGNFVVTADGEQLWHKRQMHNEFPEPEQIVARLPA